MPDELTPVTNIEKFLAKTAGDAVDLPEPVTRIEKYLNKISSEQSIISATENWLGEHIDPDTGYALDTTLTLTNAAAPAKTVGDALTSQSEKINDYDHYIVGVDDLAGNITFTDGAYINDSGVVTSFDGFRYTSLIPVEEGKTYTIYVTNGATTNPFRVHGYDSSGTWDQMITNQQIGPYGAEPPTMVKTITFTVPEGVSFIRTSTKSDKEYLAITSSPSLNAKIGATNKDIGTLNESLQTNVNVFDKTDTDNIHVGYFRGVSSGNLISNSDFTELLVPVKEGTTYRCTGTSYYTSFYDINMAKLGNTSDDNGTNKLKFTTPSYCAYVSLNIRHATYPVNTYIVTEGETLPDNYVPYASSILHDNVFTPSGNRITSYIDDGGEVYRVGADKEYTSFTDCIVALQGNTAKKTIYVDAGTYDIYDEIGGDTYAATITTDSWADWSVIVPPNTSIIGIGNVTFLFNVTSSNSHAYNTLSAINVKGSVRIENITVIATNSRYAIHDDGSSTFSKTTHIYKNVNVKKNDGQGYMQACGFGIGSDSVFEFDNCIINGRQGLSFHNSTSGYNGIISIKNSVLIGREAFGLRISSMSTGDNTHSIVVNCMGCYISQKIRVSMESGYNDRTNPYILTVSKCGDVTIDTEGYDSSSINFTPVKYT